MPNSLYAYIIWFVNESIVGKIILNELEFFFQPSWKNTDCISAERYEPPPTSVLDMTQNYLMGNVEYPFIAIAPRSAISLSGSI